MAKRDYYEVLGVARNASEADIKKSFKRLAMKHHPDRNPDDKGAEERFKEIKEAYDVLGDARKRAAYDQFGHAGVGGQGAGGFNQGAGAGFSDIFGDVFGDIFDNMRGGGRQRGSRRGSDQHYTLQLSLEEAVFGTTAKVRIPTVVVCESCHGSGVKPGSKPTTCQTCRGTGQVRMQQGFFSIQQTCPHCQGRGATISDPCRSCHGNGRVQQQKTLSVKVPAGVDDGDRIRLANEGDAGEQGAPPGDLYVKIQIREHPIFDREDNMLFCEVPISFSTAALGGELEVPTLDGRVTLKVPAGTQSGKVFRIRGKGVKPVRGGSVGDLLCKVAVATPVNLTREQRELLEKFAESMGKDAVHHAPEHRSWFDGVKRFFEDMKS